MANDILQALNEIEAKLASLTLAQNTNFDNLVAALSQIRLYCRTSVSVTNILAGDIPPSAGGTESEPPPPPFVSAEEYIGGYSYNQRKCVMATAIHNNLRWSFDKANTYQLDEALNLEIGALALILASILAEVAVFVGVPVLISPIVETSGALALVVNFIFENSGLFEYSEIVAAMDANEEELICALYESTSAQGARGAYLDILSGLSSPNQGMILVIMTDDLLNHLFFARGEDVEAAWTAWADVYDCSGCAQEECQNIRVAAGTLISGNTYQSVAGNNKQWIVLYFNHDGGGFCGSEVTLSVSNLQGWQPPAAGVSDAFQVYNQAGVKIYSSNTIPPNNIQNAARCELKSHPTAQFTCEVVVT